MKKPRNYNYSHLSIPLTKNQKKVVKEKCEARGMSMSSLAKIVLFKELGIVEFPAEAQQ